MYDIHELRQNLNKARRDEQRTRSEMERYEQQTEKQKSHLGTLMDHRDECVHGLRTAKDSGLSIVQIREYQLLLKHVDTVVQEQQEKVDLSQIKFEQARDDWKEACVKLEDVSELMDEAEAMERERKEKLINGEVEEDGLEQDDTYNGFTGRRLKIS